MIFPILFSRGAVNAEGLALYRGFGCFSLGAVNPEFPLSKLFTPFSVEIIGSTAYQVLPKSPQMEDNYSVLCSSFWCNAIFWLFFCGYLWCNFIKKIFLSCTTHFTCIVECKHYLAKSGNISTIFITHW